MINGTILESSAVALPATSLNMARRAMTSEEFERYRSVAMYRIVYASDGLRIHGYLALPGTYQDPLPAVMFNRGGIGPRGALSDVGAAAYVALYASWGYVSIASNYRGQGGSEGIEEFGGADVNDAMNSLRVLEQLNYVDQDRIGVVGGSRGGMITLMMLTRTNRFRAAVTFGAPTALHHEDKKSFIWKMMAKSLSDEATQQADAQKRSALTFADQLCKTTPLLLLHGTGDRRVAPEHSLLLAQELQKLQHPYKLIMYDNADHVLAGRREESNVDIRWWLDTYVFNKNPLPKTGPHGA